MNGKRAVITGIGPVTGYGTGKDALFDSLLQGNMKLAPVPPEYERHYSFRSRYFVPFPELDLSGHGIPKAFENIMEKAARLSVLAARLAFEDAGFELYRRGNVFQINGNDDCSAIVGVGTSSWQTGLHSYLAQLGADANRMPAPDFLQVRFNRMLIPMMMVNSVSCWPSIVFGLKGENYAVSASCASGTYAIGEAYQKIASGLSGLVLAGGVESLHDPSGAIMRGFDSLGTLTCARDGNPRPFSQSRSGFLFNEGAGCLLVIEELERARQRGAEIYAEIVDYQCNSDAHSIVQIDESGRQIGKILKKLKGSRKIDYINTHGTGTPLNDRVEARTIQEIFGDRASQPLVNSTKGLIGHSIAASGALEAAVTALSIRKGKVHGNPCPDPLENLNLALEPQSCPIEHGISVSFGFGGHNAGLLMKRYEENG